MIYIDFFGGLHGNFLAYVLNSLDKNFDRTFSPFTQFGTSHNPYPKTICVANHYSWFNIKIPDNESILSIKPELEDCLLVTLLCFGRAGDYNFNLKKFNKNFYDQIKDTNFSDIADNIHKAYNYDVKKYNNVPRGILREYFKFGFKDYALNGILKAAQTLKYSDKGLVINFKDLYTLDTFKNLIIDITQYYNLPVEVDVDWLIRVWTNFITKINEFEKVENCNQILNAIQENIHLPINFDVLQEAWLNGQLENLYSMEMPFHQEEYFQDTTEILNFIDSKK
jgi:hypothetical protein